MITTMRGELWNLYSRVKVRKNLAGGGGGGGDKRFFNFTLVLKMISNMRKSRHLRKFQTMINSLMRKLHYSPLILRRTNVRLDSCSLTIAYTLLPGDHCSLLSLSLSGCQSDGMLQN